LSRERRYFILKRIAPFKTSDRFEEMHQAFQRTQVDPFEKPHWLLVDDIITTGTTLQSFGKSMLVAPKSKLSILAIVCRK